MILVIFPLKSTSILTRSPLATCSCFNIVESDNASVQVCPSIVWKVIARWA